MIDVTTYWYSVFISLHVATQFKLLRLRLKRMTIIDNNCYNNARKLDKYLRKLHIEHKKLLINCVRVQNEIFGPMYFCCVFSSILSICLCMFASVSNIVYLFIYLHSLSTNNQKFYQVIKVNSAFYTVLYSARFVVVLLNALGNCYAAQQVIDESESIDFELYSNLMKLIPRKKFHVALFIMHSRTMQPCCINMIIIGQLGIGTFKSVSINKYTNCAITFVYCRNIYILHFYPPHR